MHQLVLFSHHIGLLSSQTDDRQIHPHRNMTEVSTGKYCQFIIIFTKYWGICTPTSPSRTLGTVPMPPP